MYRYFLGTGIDTSTVFVPVRSISTGMHTVPVPVVCGMVSIALPGPGYSTYEYMTYIHTCCTADTYTGTVHVSVLVFYMSCTSTGYQVCY